MVRPFPRLGPTPIGQSKLRLLREAGYADFDEPRLLHGNKKRARCRACGIFLATGGGVPYNEFMSDGYRYSLRFVCPGCAEATKP